MDQQSINKGGAAQMTEFLFPALNNQTPGQANVPAGHAVRCIMMGGGGKGGDNNNGGENHNGGGGGGGGAYLDVTLTPQQWSSVTRIDVGDDTGMSHNGNGGNCTIENAAGVLAGAEKGDNGVAGDIGPGAGGLGGAFLVAAGVTMNHGMHGREGTAGVNNGKGGNGGPTPGMGGAPGVGGTAAVGTAGTRGSGGGGAGTDGVTAHTGGEGGRAWLLVMF